MEPMMESMMVSQIEEAYDEIILLRKRIRCNPELHQICITKIIEITKWLKTVENGFIGFKYI
jgi:hypothetical protein